MSTDGPHSTRVVSSVLHLDFSVLDSVFDTVSLSPSCGHGLCSPFVGVPTLSTRFPRGTFFLGRSHVDGKIFEITV